MVNEYEGVWMETYSGHKFHFKNPRLEEIKIGDVAHHLSLLCRFTGACKEFYSVADHSIRVSRLVPFHLKLAALLHDSAETYINDISRPVKYNHGINATEGILVNAIERKFGVNTRDSIIKQADNVLLATEARDLMANTIDWRELPSPLPIKIKPMKPREAEGLFLRKFYEYGGKG